MQLVLSCSTSLADLWFLLQGSENEKASLFTGEEELFAFERVMSRLAEMQTQDYWNQREKIRSKREKKKEEARKKSESPAVGQTEIPAAAAAN